MCAEQSLEDKETCSLATIFLPNVESKEELLDITELLYKVNKHSLLLPSHHKDTEAVVHKNMRMGINLTGVLQSTEEQYSWLSDCYEYIRDFDKKYSEINKLRPSIKLTTIQPGGCNKKETLIETENGLMYLYEIGNIEGDTWQRINIDIAQENKKALSTQFYVNGISDTIKLTLDSGLILECTPTHKYRIIRDEEYIWEEAQNISINDKIVYALNTYIDRPYFELKLFKQELNTNTIKILQPEFLNEDLAYLLGLYYADGSNHKKGIRITGNTTTKKKNIEESAELFSNIFGIIPRIYKRKDGIRLDLYVTSIGVLNWLKNNDLLKSNPITIPYQIRCSPKSVIEAFIDGFFSGDGDFHQSGLRRFTTTSKQFSEELIILMRSIGIDCKFREMPITDSSYGSKMRYQISERKGRLAETRYISKEKVNSWKVLDNLGLDNCNTDTITAISKGVCRTFDIEVPENNTYIANSYVSHNTLSLLPGVTSGIHPAYAQYMYRRIRIASGHPLVALCKKNGYPVEYVKNFDGSEEYGTVVITFPFKYPKGTKLAKDMTAIDQLNEVRKIQEIWSDNAVSCTVYYKKEELPEIREYLSKYYKDNHKSLSFLLHNEHGFTQAPLEEITEEQYNELVSKTIPITYLNMQLDLDDSEECSTGACPVR